MLTWWAVQHVQHPAAVSLLHLDAVPLFFEIKPLVVAVVIVDAVSLLAAMVPSNHPLVPRKLCHPVDAYAQADHAFGHGDRVCRLIVGDLVQHLAEPIGPPLDLVMHLHPSDHYFRGLFI